MVDAKGVLPHHTRKNCGGHGFPSICLLLAGLCLAGCKGDTALQGAQSAIPATYKYRSLWADIPKVRVPAVTAAAQDALLQRGYSIVASSSTEDSGEVSAEPPEAGLLESIQVRTSQTEFGSRIRIIAEPAGDQTRSRWLLDAVLVRLGM